MFAHGATVVVIVRKPGAIGGVTVSVPVNPPEAVNENCDIAAGGDGLSVTPVEQPIKLATTSRTAQR